MQDPLVRIAESAQGRELLFSEILPIMRKNEFALPDLNGCLGGLRIIGVLKELGDDMPGILDLFEELMPRSSELRIAV